MHNIPQNKETKDLTRRLRKQSTFADVLIWRKLKSSQLQGYSFSQMKQLGNYVVDYYCKKLNLVVEIDGREQETENSLVSPRRRQEVLDQMGVNMLNFEEREVRRDVTSVIGKIEEYIQRRKDEAGSKADVKETENEPEEVEA